jgi:type IV secretion system protein VirB4
MSPFAKALPGGDEWFQSAGNPAELMSITRFVSDQVFATRSGGYGCSFYLAGIDAECLGEKQMAVVSSELLQALRLLPENVILYQIAVKQRGAALSFSHCGARNETVAATQRARRDHLASVPFSSVGLFWTVYIAPPARLSRRPAAQAQASAEQLRQLEQIAKALEINLARFQLRRLGRENILDLYGYLANLHDVIAADGDSPAEQLLCESVQWNDDGLKVGARHAKLFSLLRCPKSTSPDLFGGLLRIDADLVLVLETRRSSAEETRSAVSGQETFSNIFREKLLTMVSYLGNQGALDAKPQSASAKAADHSVGGLAGVLTDLDGGMAYTQTSLIGLLHSKSKAALEEQMAHVYRVTGHSQAIILQEGIGALSAYMARFPGAQIAGRSPNVRRLWLREDHAANLSLVYAPYRGEVHSKTLENEALAIFETRDGSEFYYDPYTEGGVRGCFVLGETGRGKSFLLNFLIDNEAKYGGFVFVFDVGGSFENTILKYDGRVIRFGLTGPRLNPFALPDTPENRRFAQRLVRMLLVKGGAQITPQQEADLNERVSRMFSLDASIRRLKHLILPPQLQPYLAKWIEGGVYGGVFDNTEDELDLARMVVFDFEALGSGTEQQDLMEPLLSWIRWRIASYTQDMSNLGVPKLEIYDEAWRHLKDEQMSSMIVSTSKTARKHLGGIMLATQSVEDLGSFANLIRTNCPDAMLLGGAFDRGQYAELFDLTERQLDLVSTLKRGELLLARKSYSKVLKLTVDERSKWLYTTQPQERKRRGEAIAKYGREKAFDYLVAQAAEISKG